MGGRSGNSVIHALFLGIGLVSLLCTISISSRTTSLLVAIADHDESLDRPSSMGFGQKEDTISRSGSMTNPAATMAIPDQEKYSNVTAPAKMVPTITSPTINKHSTENTNTNKKEDLSRNYGTTLSLIYPAGLVGGYRNQAMRFIGLLKHAMDKNYDSILLPTLVWSTRYLRHSRFEEAKERHTINPAVKVWPIPFDELFDVDHWNTFSKKEIDNQEISFYLPKLLSSVIDHENGTNNPNHNVCWHSQPNASIVSLPAIKRKNQNFTKSFLPLLTRRMLFGNDGDDENTEIDIRHKSFLLDPVQAVAMEYLTGNEMAKKIHKVDVSESLTQCTHPHVYGGQSKVLWNSYLQIGAEARKKHITEEMKKKLDSYTKLIETVDEALVPAKPWRALADQCIEHHLGLGEKEFVLEEEDPHVIGHDHGYIALHARVEPEMLSHACGKEMERNLTKILDLVELLALDYNSPSGLPDSVSDRANQLSYSTPISDALRKQLSTSDKEHRPLKGAFVAIAREELEDINFFKHLVNTTRYNRDVLNQRSMSYDKHGIQTYSKTLEAREQKQKQSTQTSSRRLTEEKHAINENATTPLSIFECGAGWVKHAFYESSSRQRKLFTPTSESSELSKGYGLYYKYGPQQRGGQTNFPFLPLPDNYFGDLLPSMLNFWLAVRADVFVGVQGSSWSNDVWTTRYYMGKGSRNFEYTSKKGIQPIGNGGRPKAHTNCKKRRTKGQK